MSAYSRILTTLDGSAPAEAILPHVEALAAEFGSSVTLIQVVSLGEGLLREPSSASFDPVWDELRRQAVEYLENTAAHLRQKGIDVTYESPAGSPAQVIVQRARELGADLIAMTTSGRGGLERTLFGSVADKVLRTADCPILLVRVGG
jgi:nucleotide-binding universal stress UspA family protein